MSKDILFKDIEDKTVVWFENSNRYVVLEKRAAQIVKQLHENIAANTIANSLASDFDIPVEQAMGFVQDIERNIVLPNQEEQLGGSSVYSDVVIPVNFELYKTYKIDTLTFKIDFSSEFELSLVHPKFAHLEISGQEKINHHYHVFTQNERTFLYVEDTFIGAWAYSNIHYFQGKLSMEIVQHMHQKPEKDWLGVFHASAVSDGSNGMLFLGDSGNGKSTSLALLQAHNFHCVADDFVPVSALAQDIYSFPAAISIKKNSLDVLLPFYPELKTTAEYNFTRLKKIVRFLPPKNENAITQVPCKGFVFIKYDKHIDFELTEISSIEAFEKLIPDSWLSPIPQNVTSFLDWFATIPCYRIVYSNNERMISEVSKLFANVL
ncbi:hypothetical protein RQM59_13970 [Flavobacteriaceae bacterium S356]|uniref:Aldolase n=1 Tax=Asprobacillus argus TaxID=3076534 RepID=A0ABU3LIF5_9FLAO|nr:hypothetical protein [Flavobacteriaceae bacterium S356]